MFEKLSAVLLCSTLCVSTVSNAQETESSEADTSNRILSWFKSDSHRVAVGIGVLQLRNPSGFDVPTSTHIDNNPYDPIYSFATMSFDVVGERSIGWEGRQKRLWNIHYDGEDYNGLKLQSLSFGAGVAIDPSAAFAFGGRLAVGANIGVTRSQSFFDSALHPAAELWVSAGVQLGRFTADLSVRERQTMGSTLDERSAAPRTQSRMFSLGWVF